MIRLYIVFVVLFLLLCSISTALAGDSDSNRASLKGLQGVHVLVEHQNPPEVEG
jgi:hypothetical protein